MRKWIVILSVCLVIFIAVATASASTGTYKGYSTVSITVNGQPLSGDVPAIVMDGRTLVPLRLVGEALGASITYQPSTKTVHIVDQAPDRPIEIETLPGFGGVAFKHIIEETLYLLKVNAPEYYNFVTQHISTIKQYNGRAFYVTPRKAPSTVYGSDEYLLRLFETEEPKGKINIWMASVLVHEAAHIMRNSNKELTTTPEIEEQFALDVQTRFLKAIDAPQDMIDYCTTAIETRWWEDPEYAKGIN